MHWIDRYVSFDQTLKTTLLVWLCGTFPHAFYLIDKKYLCCLIRSNKMLECLFYDWNVHFVYPWKIVISINPFRCKTPYWAMWKCSPLSFLKLFRCRYHSWWPIGRVRRVPECPKRFWSILEGFLVFMFCLFWDLY